MDLRTIAWVTWKVFDEMDDIKDILRVKITDIIPRFLGELGHHLDHWRSHPGVCTGPDPSPSQCCAAQTERLSRENTTKDCTTPCQVLMMQLAKA
ncbi:hypothetical protein L210DRAFT_1012157 [Boletus edulis BED1]|uniref:Uncharacterized protein n=1 Tax=Boletus edulis BED1 TaxID=1328754 RepID=A0AAD4C699_BOLED|nr:hypothetical protein L210DRAFT_1012157 [Boletus edulis BED1]